MSGLELRRADEADAEEIRALLATAFAENPKTDPDVMKWQYRCNPFGDAVSWVWVDDGRVVSHTARLPVPILFEGRPAMGALAVDAATAPEHRGRGLHDSKRNAANADCCERGLIAGFHLQAPGSPLPRTAAPVSGRVMHFIRPIDADWLAARLHIPAVAARAVVRRDRGAPPGVDALEVRGTPDGIDALWAEVAPLRPFGIVKDERWWRWRYDAHPHRPYRFFVARRGGALVAAAPVLDRDVAGVRFAYVLELLARDPDAAAALIREVASACCETAAISFRAPPRTHVATIARSSGMYRIPRRLEPSPLTLNVRDMCGNAPELVGAPWCVGWGEDDRL